MNRVSKDAYYKNIKTNEIYKLVRIKRDKRKPTAFLAKVDSNELIIIKVTDLKRSSIYQEVMNPIDTATAGEVSGIYSHYKLNNNQVDDTAPRVKTVEDFVEEILHTVEPAAKTIARIAKRVANSMRGAVKR